MRCVICKQGDTQEGRATVTLEVGHTTLVVKGVPAQVCQSCGEKYFDEKITNQLINQAKDAARGGVQVDIRKYVAA